MRFENIIRLLTEGKQDEAFLAFTTLGLKPLSHPEKIMRIATGSSITRDDAINGTYANGRTLLMFVCERGTDQFLQELLKLEPNVDITDRYGNTALHFAVQAKKPQMVLRLCAVNARCDIKNNDGFTPLAQAKSLQALSEKNENATPQLWDDVIAAFPEDKNPGLFFSVTDHEQRSKRLAASQNQNSENQNYAALQCFPSTAQ